MTHGQLTTCSVFPTHVGVHRLYVGDNNDLFGIPHVRGGPPEDFQRVGVKAAVFPACAGVDLTTGGDSDYGGSIPRACGGGPSAAGMTKEPAKIFPARAGVDPSRLVSLRS